MLGKLDPGSVFDFSHGYDWCTQSLNRGTLLLSGGSAAGKACRLSVLKHTTITSCTDNACTEVRVDGYESVFYTGSHEFGFGYVGLGLGMAERGMMGWIRGDVCPRGQLCVSAQRHPCSCCGYNGCVRVFAERITVGVWYGQVVWVSCSSNNSIPVPTPR